MPVYTHVVAPANSDEASVISPSGEVLATIKGKNAKAEAKIIAAEYNALLNIERATPVR